MNQEASFDDLKKIQEVLFRDRTKRDKDSYLPENNNSLSLAEREEVADKRRSFKTDRERKKREMKDKVVPVEEKDTFSYTFKLDKQGDQATVCQAKDVLELKPEK